MESKRAVNFVDNSGKQFSSWSIINYIETKNKRPIYLCRCVCGKEKNSILKDIVNGRSKSCGCQNVKNHITHGMSKTKVYNIWQNIKNRCTNKKSGKWHRYGGRGISMCENWFNSFDEFFKDMGHPPTTKHSIDRIDNDGNYEPTNCKWSTQKEQCNNRGSKQPLPTPPSNG